MARPRVYLNNVNRTLSVVVGHATGLVTLAEAQVLIGLLERGIAELSDAQSQARASSAAELPPASVHLQHAGTVLEALRPRLDRLPPLAMRWHEANLRLRLQHAGRQFDQRTIAKQAALAEHRHGTAYFRAGEDVGLGKYEGGHFYYAGERYAIVPPGSDAARREDMAAQAERRQAALL